MKKIITTLALLCSMPVALAQALDTQSKNSPQNIVLNQDNWSGMIDKSNLAKKKISNQLSADLIEKRNEDIKPVVKENVNLAIEVKNKVNPGNRLGEITENDISTKIESIADKLLEAISIIFFIATIPFIFRLASHFIK